MTTGVLSLLIRKDLGGNCNICYRSANSYNKTRSWRRTSLFGLSPSFHFLGGRRTLRLLGPTSLGYFRSLFDWLSLLPRFLRVPRFLVVTYAQTPGPSGLPASIDRAIFCRALLSARLAGRSVAPGLFEFFEQTGTFNPCSDASSDLIAYTLEERVEDILYVDWACHRELLVVGPGR